MRTVAEIEAAIEELPAPEVEELARRLDAIRARRGGPPPVESWLARARGAAAAGVMAATRGEE